MISFRLLLENRLEFLEKYYNDKRSKLTLMQTMGVPDFSILHNATAMAENK
jgi:hypothetical protein